MLTNDQITKVWDENDRSGSSLALFWRTRLYLHISKAVHIRLLLLFFVWRSRHSRGKSAILDSHYPFSVLTALMSAYSIAVGLDKKATTMAKLFSTWNQIQTDGRHLWNHWYEDDAEEKFINFIERIGLASEIAITAAPYDKKLLT